VDKEKHFLSRLFAYKQLNKTYQMQRSLPAVHVITALLSLNAEQVIAIASLARRDSISLIDIKSANLRNANFTTLRTRPEFIIQVYTCVFFVVFFSMQSFIYNFILVVKGRLQSKMYQLVSNPV